MQICKLISATFMHWLRPSGTSQVIYLMNPECQVYERIKCIHLEKKDKLNTEKEGMPQPVLLTTEFQKGIGKI